MRGLGKDLLVIIVPEHHHGAGGSAPLGKKKYYPDSELIETNYIKIPWSKKRKVNVDVVLIYYTGETSVDAILEDVSTDGYNNVKVYVTKEVEDMDNDRFKN